MVSQRVLSNKSNINLPAKVAFLFSGHGSQYPKMGWDLYETQPIFQQAMNECNEILRSYMDVSLHEVVYQDSGKFFKQWDATYLFPALFAVEYALFKLWQSCDVMPSLVGGISVGEFAAACVAGVFSLEDGLKLAATYGTLVGGMQLNECRTVGIIGPSEEQVAKAVQLYAPEVEITFYAGIKTAIAGLPHTVQAVIDELRAANLKLIVKELPILNIGLHTYRVEQILADFEQVARQVTYSSPQVEFVSIATGNLVTAEVATPKYWLNNLRQPSRLSALIKTATEQGYEVFVECGPGEITLKGAIACICRSERLLASSEREVGVWLPSLLEKSSDCQTMQQSLKELNTCGVPVNWGEFYLNCSSRVSVDRTLKSKEFEEQLQKTAELSSPQLQNILQLLEEASEVARLELLIVQTQNQVAQVLKLPQLPRPNQSFVEMGMESLGAMELMTWLKLNLGVSLPLTVLVHFPNIRALSKYILGMKWQKNTDVQFQEVTTNETEGLINPNKGLYQTKVAALSNQHLVDIVSHYMQVYTSKC